MCILQCILWKRDYNINYHSGMLQKITATSVKTRNMHILRSDENLIVFITPT